MLLFDSEQRRLSEFVGAVSEQKRHTTLFVAIQHTITITLTGQRHFHLLVIKVIIQL